MIGFRSLKYPAAPDPATPDYHAQCARYWAESRVWWDNWSVNFGRCLILLLAAFTIGIVFAIALG
jgi:hypothetical protein